MAEDERRWEERAIEMIGELHGRELAVETAVFVLRTLLPKNERERVDQVLQMFLDESLLREGNTSVLKGYRESLGNMLRNPSQKE